jgi:hypothetical protein
MIKELLMITMPTAIVMISGNSSGKINYVTRFGTPVANNPVVTNPLPTPTGSSSIFLANGSIDSAAYTRYVSAWDKTSVSERLGPTFEALNPNAADTRPTHFKPASKECTLSFANRINPYELGAEGCKEDNDYWSDTGQVAYVPDDLANDPGLDRIQTFAYYNHVFALSPRLDYGSGTPHPDFQTQETYYKEMLGGKLPKYPVAMVRNYAMLSNEALVLYRGGLLGVAGTQTSREGYERPYPGLLFPAHKVPTSIALTTSNEFALITIMDTQTKKGQLAVVALEAKYLPFHTWPYMALPNQGSWSAFKLLGYIDLPMVAPNSVAASSNGWWNGPSQTNNQVLSQIDLNDAGVRWGMVNGEPGWSGIIANKGYAIVASKEDNKAVILDLTALFAYVRESYLTSAESFQATVANKGNAAGQWPATFAEKPSIAPRIVWEKSLTAPTAVLAGLRIDRWSTDRQKAYIARQDGTIHIVDTSSLLARFEWEKIGALTEIGTVKVGRNPVSMAFARFTEGGLPHVPAGQNPDPLNNQFYVACRGDREINAVVTYEGQGSVYRRISDSRLSDPVAVSVAMRGNIVTVADFAGKKILSFRIGGIMDRYNRWYGCGADGKAAFEFTGELSFKGNPIAVNSTNLN